MPLRERRQVTEYKFTGSAQMNRIRKFLTNASIVAWSTVALLAVGETAIHAATITGDFKITGVIGTEVDDSVLGTFEGEDLDENGILSELELTNFSTDIMAERLIFIQNLELEDVSKFELNLEQLDFEFAFGKSVNIGDFFQVDPSTAPICVRPDGGDCVIEIVSLRQDSAYLFDYPYSRAENLRFFSRIEAGFISAARDFPPTVEVSLNPQSVPEPSVVLGLLAVLGLGSKLKKVK